jgi:hypothetical protein
MSSHELGGHSDTARQKRDTCIAIAVNSSQQRNCGGRVPYIWLAQRCSHLARRPPFGKPDLRTDRRKLTQLCSECRIPLTYTTRPEALLPGCYPSRSSACHTLEIHHWEPQPQSETSLAISGVSRQTALVRPQLCRRWTRRFKRWCRLCGHSWNDRFSMLATRRRSIKAMATKRWNHRLSLCRIRKATRAPTVDAQCWR